MPKIFTIIRKVITAGSGDIQFRNDVSSGIKLTNLLTAILFTIRKGFVISQAPFTLLTRQNPALSISTVNSGTAANELNTPALSLSNASSGTSAVAQQTNPATDIKQVVYSLTRRVGGNAVVETAVGGRTDWANDANAINGTNGLHNGSPYATFDGSALGARGGRLDIDYADMNTQKAQLTITQVQLHFYLLVTGTVLNNADVQLQYDVGGGIVTLETITGDVTSLITPRTFDITAAVAGNWANLDALTAYVRAEAAIAETWHVDLDAVEVEIIANRTDTL